MKRLFSAIPILLFAFPAHSRAEQTPEHTNHLINEKSPYLLQHAHNPVNWYPWGEEAFAKAREEKKPIFLSVGYSTCHWCHVMERESFESAEIAKILNQNYVAIKVDREERPDVDKVYMTFVQATTGGGGWPMSVWLTPDLKPFYGATYFPAKQFADVLNKIGEAWEGDRENIVASSDKVIEELKKMTAASTARHDSLPAGIRKKAFDELSSVFDEEFGGFGSAPKFPRPATLDFLFHYYADSPVSADGKRALEMALLTLRKMSEGGIHDHLGGGFHRYSVDRFWHVPHFEKMLYDQAQLASAYTTAFQITGKPLFEQTARDILDYVLRDMKDASGAFYSAEDADSHAKADDSERVEGAFYVWTREEIGRILGAEKAGLFNETYGVKADGNAPAASDPRGEFLGENILFRKTPVADPQVEASLAECRALLLKEREKRPRPRRDDKIITAWNGLMISAYARAAQVFDESVYREAAVRAAAFIRKSLYSEESGILLRSYREGAGETEGFAEDYAFLIQALLDLYETDFDARHLQWAVKLQEKQDGLFFDESSGGYFSTTGDDAAILLRSKESYDGAEPSPSSIAGLNLLRLSKIFDRKDWRDRAEKTIAAFTPQLGQSPTALPQMLVALDWLRATPRQIVIAGQPDAPDTLGLLRELRRHYIPDKIVLLADSGESQKYLAGKVAFMKNVASVKGKAAAYVCENFVCKLPVTGVAELRKLLQPVDVPVSEE